MGEIQIKYHGPVDQMMTSSTFLSTVSRGVSKMEERTPNLCFPAPIPLLRYIAPIQGERMFKVEYFNALTPTSLF